MTGYIIFWSIVIFFSLLSFSIMSLIMLTRGISELKDMFKQLSESNSNDVIKNRNKNL